MVLGAGNNPVVRRMVDEIIHIREHGVSRSGAIGDARLGVTGLLGLDAPEPRARIAPLLPAMT